MLSNSITFVCWICLVGLCMQLLAFLHFTFLSLGIPHGSNLFLRSLISEVVHIITKLEPIPGVDQL